MIKIFDYLSTIIIFVLMITSTRLHRDIKELLGIVVRYSANLPKHARFFAGAEMQRLALDMNTQFGIAYLSNDKRCVDAMNTLTAELETLKTLVTLAVDNKWIYGNAGHLVKLLDSVTKQSTALRNSFVKKYGTELRYSAYSDGLGADGPKV